MAELFAGKEWQTFLQILPTIPFETWETVWSTVVATLMALVIGMTDEEHIDSLLEVARYVSSCEDDFHNRDDMVDCLVDDISQCIDADIPRIMAFVHNCCKKF